MTDYTKMQSQQLKKLSAHFKHEEFAIMKELIRRNDGANSPIELEPADMFPTEEDF
jgi:hypothetical protein